MHRHCPSYFWFRLSAQLLLGLSAAFAAAQRGALVAHRNIAELTQQAATIIHGNVTSARIEPHPELTNLTTVVVTLRVNTTLKGTAASTYTFRQFVWDARAKYDGAGYQKGQELLVLLNPVSSYGLTSPTGMEQGRFVITRDAKGNAVALNGYGNAGLFADMDTQAQTQKVRLSPSAVLFMKQHPSGPVPIDRLESLIQQFAGAAK